MTPLRTHAAGTIASVILGAPDVSHYAAQLSATTGIASNVVGKILDRFTAAGFLECTGTTPSPMGGSPRKMFKVRDVHALRAWWPCCGE